MSGRRAEESPEAYLRRKGGTSEKHGPNGLDEEYDNSEDDIQFKELEAIPAEQIAPRRWAYGKFMLFGSASVIGAVDGAGKGNLAVGVIIAFTTGLEVLGEKVWRTGKVGVVTYEDDEDEWRRRIAAACILLGADYAKVMANVRFIYKPDGKVTFAQQALKGGPLFPDSDKIIRGMRRLGIVALIVDPFNNAHSMDDGNNNVLITCVAYEFSRIAKETGATVLALHHLRKGATGDIDDLMGATALRANFRSCRIFVRMTRDEARQLQLPENENWRYLRIAGTKSNYAPPPDKVFWYKLASVPLNNGTDEYPDGDNMGVATPWEPPKAFDGLDRSTMRIIFDLLRAGPSEAGWKYSLSSRQKYWAGTVIQEKGGKSKDQAAAVLATWKENEVVTEASYKNPNRDVAMAIVLNEVKIAQMLGPEWGVDE